MDERGGVKVDSSSLFFFFLHIWLLLYHLLADGKKKDGEREKAIREKKSLAKLVCHTLSHA